MKKLLVVVDMQNDFITGTLGTKEAQAIVPGIVDYIKCFDGDVIATMDTHYDDYLDTQEGKKLPVVHCIKDTEGWLLNKDIGNLVDRRVLKNTFGSTKLGEIIAAEGFEEVHFVGVCTGICVISNAIIAKSFNPNARIVIHKDFCACVTSESHERALKSMETLQMDII